MASLLTLLKNPMVLMGMVVLCLFFVWGISRNWSCKKSWADRRDERQDERSQKEATFAVAEVIDGATIDVLTGRFKRSNRITLQGIEIPAEVATEAKENLIRLTSGGSVTVHWIHHGLFSESGEPIEESAYDAPTPISGIVFADRNCCAQLEQIRAGLAKCNSEANEIMKTEEKWAKSHKRGIWK